MQNILPLESMPDEELRKIKLVVFDCDGVVVSKGTKIKESIDGSELSIKSYMPSDDFISAVIELKKHVRVAFSSGRSLMYLKNLSKGFFDRSIILQSENGGMAYIDGKITHPDYPNEYFEVLYKVRNMIADNAEMLTLRGFEPKFFILTAHVDSKNEVRINEILKRADPSGIITWVWGGEAYDFGLKGVNKGSALGAMSEKLNLKKEEILTTGNAMNDKEMLEFGIGVTIEPTVVWGKYKTSGKGLGGEEIARFLVERFIRLKK